MNATKSYDDQLHAAVEIAVARCNSTTHLPFVELDPDNAEFPRSAWTVTETGDFAADVVTGLAYADLLIRRAKMCSSPLGRLMIEAVLQDLVRKGKVGPIEQGFLGRVVMAAIVASQN
jgi:hypothetical protein